MNKAIKIRIYPTDEQKTLIEKTFGCCRWVWNAMLSERKEAYEKEGKSVQPTPAKYKADNEWLKEVDSLALCNVQQNLNKSYKAFFDGIKGKGPKGGYPKFKSKKVSKRSYTTNNQENKNGGFSIEYKDKTLKLPKLGFVECDMYRDNIKGVIKTVTISEPIDGIYYASICFEFDCIIPETTISENLSVLGLDYASNGLYVDSEGNNCNMPHFYRKGQKKLAKLQRRMSKKQRCKDIFIKSLGSQCS